MENGQEQMIIRNAAEDDARQIAEILVEDWQTAYRGIIDSAFLDAMSAEERYQTEVRRCRKYQVAVFGQEILGYVWTEMSGSEDADCEIVALYVRYAKRKNGTGRALFRHSAEQFRTAGRKKMIVWCLKENTEARKFYEKMGGKAYKTGSHSWGGREYDMISYLYGLDG